jgi:CubicO group peptidase (beta-lactamase class C family)
MKLPIALMTGACLITVGLDTRQVQAQNRHQNAYGLGMDLVWYCSYRHGSSARLVLRENNAYGWKCEVNGRDLDIDVFDVCRSIYGVTAKPVMENFNDRNSWYCTNPVASNSNQNVQDFATMPITGTRVPELDVFDQAMLRFMQERSIKAGTLAISKDGRVIFSRGYGYGDPQLRTALAPNALMRIASVDKPVTNAAIKTLIRQGRISLESRAFPQLGITRFADPRLGNLTVQHLLEHKWYEGAQGFDAVQVAEALGIASPATPLDIARYIAAQPLRYEPGTNGSYCNFCHDLLREIVRRVSGKSYAEFLKTKLSLFDAESTYPFSRNRHSREVWYSDPGYCRNVYQPYNRNQVPCTEGGFPIDPPASLVTSAPALAEFFGRYWINGEPRSPMARGGVFVFFGSWVGTFSLAYQRPDGVNIVVLFNQRTDPSGLDYGAIKDVMENAANSITSWR